MIEQNRLVELRNAANELYDVSSQVQQFNNAAGRGVPLRIMVGEHKLMEVTANELRAIVQKRYDDKLANMMRLVDKIKKEVGDGQ